jgi:dTDP-glucose 4,6-dehydratase
MRILVTGGAGFIGSNFLRLAFDGTFKGIDSVKVLDKLTYAGVLANIEKLTSHKDFEFILGDICDQKTVESALDEIDLVINFAAESHVDRSINGSKDFIQTNVVGVQVILDAIMKKNPSIRFLQISTDEVYGSINEGSWDENCLLKPNSPYSASKASGELIARSYFQTHGIDVVTTRCSNNYGVQHYPEKLIPLFITNLIEGKKLPMYGNGLNVRDWLHVEDHCRGIFLVAKSGKSGEVYNIGGGQELSNIEITNLILSEMGVDDSFIEFVPDRLGHDLRYSVNWNKIKNELGYSPQVDFKSGLKETIAWYQENEDWWKPLKKA